MNEKLTTTIQDILKPKKALGSRALCELRGRSGCFAFYS